MLTHSIKIFAILGILLMASCGSTDESGGTEPADDIELTGVVTDLLSGAGIEGVRVCHETDATDCPSTNASGEYTISVSPATELMLTLTTDDYLPVLLFVPETEASTSLRPVSLLTADLQSVQESLVGVETQDENGGLVFGVSNGIAGDGINVPNITVNLEPSEGEGPFYTASSGLPQMSLEATSDHGGGLFANIEPGDYTTTFGGLPDDCVVLFGWGSPDRVRTRIKAGHVSVVRVECMETDLESTE